MDLYLLSLGCEGDVFHYADVLERELGIRTPDDLLLEEPSMEDLEEIGIHIPADRERIFYEFHPELKTIVPESLGIEEIIKPKEGFDPISYEEAKSAIMQANIPKMHTLLSDPFFNVNMQDTLNDNNTLLHWAVLFKHLGIIQILIEKGAVQLPNAKLKVPLDIAVEAYESGDTSYHEIVQYLFAQTQKQLGLV
eukprot:TRINITY_DN14298_c0_g1_i1.p2 TRINITY_DN14298_c0_g1~~TRINITY_DN14298_c0_g1_i1.p2  ORF type:complete len:194 (+),score=47.40 TRINITY_DN14298_c0_g1_i1:147-728(+)